MRLFLYVEIQDQRQKYLGKNRVKYTILGVVMSEIQRKVPNGFVDNSLVISTVKKLIEGINESLKYSTDIDKISRLNEEKEVLLTFIPEQLSNDELLEIMKDLISKDPTFSEKKNMFPYLKANYDSQYDGKTANMLFSQL